ncbi:hypothetical protein [Hymenobacter crusticola]|uniref:hypothetical protein n=1 Tax=Hymenobacter crusticola TaxID=1770526 RepID=UPI00117A8CF7|nr:hypothetical protein [Hymenobacter crusticola]
MAQGGAAHQVVRHAGQLVAGGAVVVPQIRGHGRRIERHAGRGRRQPLQQEGLHQLLQLRVAHLAVVGKRIAHPQRAVVAKSRDETASGVPPR